MTPREAREAREARETPPASPEDVRRDEEPELPLAELVQDPEPLLLGRARLPHYDVACYRRHMLIHAPQDVAATAPRSCRHLNNYVYI